MKKERKVWAMTLIALWLLAPSKTNAQQDSVVTSNLEEIVVTATKFPKSQSETGKVLTIIDEDQLKRSAGKDISQLLNEQVGIVIAGANSNPGKDKSVFLRGAGSGYTLILLDGIPVNDPSGIGGAFDLRMLPIDQIERIEILKGSQSALYGSDAVAGVINIITKKKGNKPFGVNGTATYGTYNTKKGNIGVSGSTDVIDYNAGYTYYKTDGISEAKDTIGTQGFDKDGFDQNSFQTSVGVHPAKGLTLRPFVRYSKFNGKYDAGAFSDDVVPVYHSKFLNTGISGDYAFSKGTVHVQYARDNVKRTYITRDYFKPDSSVASGFSGYFDNAEVYANYDLAEHFQVLGGVNYQHHKMTSSDLKDSTLHIVNPFLSFFVKDVHGFSTEIGGRLVHHSVFGDIFVYSFNPSYVINNQVKLFANYSTGFKAPYLDQLYNPSYGNPKLKPEKSKNLEGGIQFATLDNRIDIRGTVFSRKINNVIIYQYPGYINFNKQNDLGFELESTFNVTEKLRVKAFYAFVKGEVTTKNSAERDTTFNNLIRRPKHSIGINVGYAFTNNFYVSANLKTFGKRGDMFFNSTTFATEAVSLKAYQLVDIYAEYKLLQGKLKVFADLHNVLDKNYYEIYGYSTMGFNMNAGVTFGL
ncbi:TonB-dependent receptor plug domain-containing protein [Ohtaekwangia sp.]|uniref:TonB-dependent receptor plug domain-containing protein n=1 Tax=Ohtaekwangia sp. TaxID=2066019 RepID=UPI002FDEAE63